MSVSSEVLSSSFSVSLDAVVIASSISFWDATDGVSLSSVFDESLIKSPIVSLLSSEMTSSINGS